jgi:hypothetical protein
MLWMLFLSPTVFAADVVSVDVKCAEAPKSFVLSDDKSEFKEVSIIKGQKIRIKSRSPNEDVMIDCRELMTPEKAEAQSWSGVRQEVKIGFWDYVIPFMLASKISKSEITLTNKNDFPVYSKIVVQQSKNKTEVTLTQTPWKGDGIRISCPSKDRFRDESIQVTVYKAGKAQSFYALKDNEIGRPVSPDPNPKKIVCDEERYSVSLNEGRLQKAGGGQNTPASSTGGENVK